MKKCILLSLLITSLTCAQFRLGFNIDVMTKSEDLNYQFGPGLILQYGIQNVPIDIQFNCNFYISEIKSSVNTSGLSTYTRLETGLSAIYSPIKWYVEPFIGTGIYYNANSAFLAGNGYLFQDGSTMRFNSILNNFSYKIIIGINFLPQRPTNIHLETNFVFSEPEYESTYNSMGRDNLIRNKFKFNSLFTKLTFIFLL